jgi:hypothetical protein
VDWARIFYYTQTIDNCAWNGAMFASNTLNTTNWQGSAIEITSVEQAVIAGGASLNPPLTAANVAVVNGYDADGNSDVTVTVTYTFKPVAPFPGLPSQQTLVRKAQMRVAPANPS